MPQVEGLLRLTSGEDGQNGRRQETDEGDVPTHKPAFLIGLRRRPTGKTGGTASKIGYSFPPTDYCSRFAQLVRNPNRDNRQTCYRQPSRETLSNQCDRQT
jgi:hypothetical protein